MNPKEVVSFIEGEPFISVVPLEPGLTNLSKKETGVRVVGFNSENAEINEGLVRFDIVFYVRMKDGLSQMIINVEAQKDAPAEYSILNRAIFYVCRLVSSQKKRDFAGMDYDDIKRVVSIWICMNMPENSLDYYYLANKNSLGSYQWKGKQDMLNIVLVGLSKDLPEQDDEKCELHRLLGALLSKELTTDEKLAIIEQEYDIPLADNLRKDVGVMCNLSQGIVDDTKEEIIMNMHENNFTVEQIALATRKSIEEVKAIIVQQTRK